MLIKQVNRVNFKNRLVTENLISLSDIANIVTFFAKRRREMNGSIIFVADGYTEIK